MPLAYKRQDDLDDMLAAFASIDHLEQPSLPKDQEAEDSKISQPDC